MAELRINRYLSSCGLGSRRACEQLVLEGRVLLNGHRLTDLAARIGRDDNVHVDGELVQPEKVVVLLLNKPKKTLCTRDDPRGRETVYHLLPERFQQLAHVGRLDRDSEGLLVLTNSGDLSHKLTHPSSKVEKEYVVHLDRDFDTRDRSAFLRGIRIEEGIAKAASLKITQPRILHIVLRQGLKRQIRLMCKSKGYMVKRLERVRIGSLTAPQLPVSRWRVLSPPEIALLQRNPGPERKNEPSPSPERPAPRQRPGSPRPRKGKVPQRGRRPGKR